MSKGCSKLTSELGFNLGASEPKRLRTLHPHGPLRGGTDGPPWARTVHVLPRAARHPPLRCPWLPHALYAYSPSIAPCPEAEVQGPCLGIQGPRHSLWGLASPRCTPDSITVRSPQAVLTQPPERLSPRLSELPSNPT